MMATGSILFENIHVFIDKTVPSGLLNSSELKRELNLENQ